ncbi:MAG: hypothetical protein BWX80_03569 [Candidatus Hydrogenedentes bacterium ADurb.Bin101]|nr:MAG: hypothetical protein BWX80_03569 [Candidatus Hydrogenedentes bacterium ADurb.Bin101]
MAEGIKVALRGIPAAHVLDDQHQAPLGEEYAWRKGKAPDHDLLQRFLVIRQSYHDGGKGAGPVGPVNVRGQTHPVAHGYHHVLFHHHFAVHRLRDAQIHGKNPVPQQPPGARQRYRHQRRHRQHNQASFQNDP